MSGFVFEKKYEIHYYEVDYKGKALITSIVDFLGDIATRQSENLGVGMDYLRKNNLGWVLYKWDINMYKYPVYGEKITIKTIPDFIRKFYAYRYFEILNEEGETIGKAESMWFLINIEKRRTVKIDENIYNAYGVELRDNKILKIEDIEEPMNINSEKVFDVRYSDIDTNKHVNNAKYIGWAIETVPMEIISNYNLRNVKVVYEKETTYGELVKVLTEINYDEQVICTHKIVGKDSRKLTIIKTIWDKI